MCAVNYFIAEKLKAGGERMTPLRSALLDILQKSHEPKTPQELLASLTKRGLSANKTTVYRQLDTLTRYNVVSAVNFADRITRYEMVNENEHHHHLVCIKCGRIEDVSFKTDLDGKEKWIWKKHNFKVLQHSLEFFGVCKKCLSKK